MLALTSLDDYLPLTDMSPPEITSVSGLTSIISGGALTIEAAGLTSITSGALTVEVAGLMSITSDRAITIAGGFVKFQGSDITFNGEPGTTNTDIWFGNIQSIYFGVAADNSVRPPAQGALGYFARQEGGTADIKMDAWISSASAANTLHIRRARGTPGSPSAVLSGDRLGTIEFRGYGGETPGQVIGALMRVEATENFGASSHGGKLRFQTVLTGSDTATDRLVFTGDNQAVFSGLLLLRAGAAGVGTAPLKLQSGSLNTTPESGALEFDGTHLYFTIGSIRYQLDQQ